MEARRSWRTVLALALPGVAFIAAVATAQTWGDGMYHEGMHEMMWGGKLPPVSVSGRTIVDTAAMPSWGGMHPEGIRRYFVDTIGNGVRHYELFFGPYWYQPQSGARRPAAGEMITVRGGRSPFGLPPVIVIYEINGKVWRDTTGAPPFSGRWVHRSITDTARVFCPVDSLSWAGYVPGFMGTGMMGGGMMWPDSIFCSFDEVFPDSLPGMPHNGAIRGFHFDVFNPQGMPMMQSGPGGHGRMGFQSPVSLRIQLHPDSLSRHGVSLGMVRAKYYDTDGQWKDFSGQEVRVAEHTITVTQDNVFSYVAIVPSGTSGINGQTSERPAAYVLAQNFPNPFNPSTTIGYGLPEKSSVLLTVFNSLGQQVAVLQNEEREAGFYQVTFEGDGLPNGVYFYRLRAGSFLETRRLLLIK